MLLKAILCTKLKTYLILPNVKCVFTVNVKYILRNRFKNSLKAEARFVETHHSSSWLGCGWSSWLLSCLCWSLTWLRLLLSCTCSHASSCGCGLSCSHRVCWLLPRLLWWLLLCTGCLSQLMLSLLPCLRWLRP